MTYSHKDLSRRRGDMPSFSARPNDFARQPSKDLYMLQVPKETPAMIFGREPEHIMETVNICRQGCDPDCLDNLPDCIKWLAKEPTMEDILLLGKASLILYDRTDTRYGPPIALPVDETLTIYLGLSLLELFDRQREVMTTKRIAHLFYFPLSDWSDQVTVMLPEDIMQATRGYSLKPLYELKKQMDDIHAKLESEKDVRWIQYLEAPERQRHLWITTEHLAHYREALH